MMLNFLRLTLSLTTASEMHIGTGVSRELGKNKLGDEQGDSATYFKDHLGLPFIPGSTLKGVLRSLLPAGAERDAWFGTIKDDGLDGGLNGGSGDIGRLWVMGARCDKDAVVTHETRKRTKVDAERGAPENKKLFSQDIVPIGTNFEFPLVWHLNGPEPSDENLEGLAKVLALLQSGIAVGKQTRLGEGQLKLTTELTASGLAKALAVTLVPTKTDKATDANAAFGKCLADLVAKCSLTPAKTLWSQNADIHCPGFYTSLDVDNQQRASETDGASRPFLRDQNDDPRLHVQSLLGVLRHDALWWANYTHLTEVGEAPLTALDRVQQCGNEQQAQLDTVTEVLNASWIERLFGMPGFRGRLEIGRIQYTCDTQRPSTEINRLKIDRLTGGALDGALASFEVARDVKYRFTLSVKGSDHSGLNDQLKLDVEQLERFLADHYDFEPLMLGAGNSHGLGWFDLKLTEAVHG